MLTNPKRAAFAVAALGTLAVVGSATLGSAAVVPARPGQAVRPASRLAHPPPSGSTPTPIYAGGGSAAAIVWRAWGDNYGVPLGQPAPVSKPNVEELYASSNEGSAVRYLLDQAFDNQTTPSNTPAYTDTTNGRNFTWVYPNAQATPAPPDFTSGGSPLSNATITEYDSLDQATRGNAIATQVLATGEALAYNLGPNSVLGSRSLQLSRKTYCGILTGNITDWSDSHVANDNGGAVVSASTPIEVVYRTDTAGQSFLVTENIATVCAATGYAWTGGVSTTFTPPAPPPAGSTFVGESGNSSEEKEILAPKTQPGALGYLSPSYVQPQLPTGPPAAVLGNKTGAFVALTSASIQAAVAGGPYAKPPSGYPVVTDGYIPNPKAKTGYPIVGFIWAYFYTCYPNTNPDITPLKAFFKAALALDGKTGPTAYDTIAVNNTFAPLGSSAKTVSLVKIGKIKLINPGASCP